MNFIRAELIHKAFLMQPIKAFSFVHYNTNIKVSKNNDCLVVELVGRRGQKGLLEIFHDLYDLLFLMLGAYPIRQNLTYNDKAIDTSEWVGRYMTATHFNETEAAFGDITIENINSNSLINIKKVHMQSLSSLSHIVSKYYEHVVTNHKIELMLHTIDGFFIHSIYYDELLQKKRQKAKCNDTKYNENVERVFKQFFYYHRKYNCEILSVLGITKKIFYKTVTDTRNDFSHLLGKKKNRLISGGDMVYYMDLIFIAERLFILDEILNLRSNESMIQEYMYIMHDWIDEVVNNRKNRIKSKRYINIQKLHKIERNLCLVK